MIAWLSVDDRYPRTSGPATNPISPIVRLYPRTLPSCFFGVRSATQACVCPHNPLANPNNTISNVKDDTESDSESNSETMPVRRRLMAIGFFLPKESVSLPARIVQQRLEAAAIPIAKPKSRGVKFRSS